MRNLPLTFDCSTYSQKLVEDFAKFCGLLRIYELYLWRQANKNWEFSSKQSCICVLISFKRFGQSKRFNFLGKALTFKFEFWELLPHFAISKFSGQLFSYYNHNHCMLENRQWTQILYNTNENIDNMKTHLISSSIIG